MATIYIGHASKDENNKYTGGKAGDQTGKEVCKRTYYKHANGWHALRPKNVNHANAIVEAMQQAVDNDNVGYDQGERSDIMTSLKKYGSIKKIAEPTECDCSSLVRACIYQATGKDVGSFTTANEASVLAKSGLFENKFSVYSSSSLYNGDILVTQTKGHTVIVISGNPRKAVATTTEAQQTTTTTATTTNNNKQEQVTTVSKGDAIVKKGQQHAIDFTGVKIDVDGIVGNDTNKMKVRVLQHAMNLDYGKTINEDGVFGSKSKAKLGSHYVAKYEKQYMVTAAEILMELHGIDPKGVEMPGIYGNGLVNAAKRFFGDNGRKITASKFLKLVK